MPGGCGIDLALKMMRMENERIAAAQDRRRKRLARRKRRIARDRQAAAVCLDVTEDDLARMLLLAMAANQLLQQKRVLSPDGIDQMTSCVDMWDRQADGMLDPAVLRPEESYAAASPRSPREFLRQLEQQDQ